MKYNSIIRPTIHINLSSQVKRRCNNRGIEGKERWEKGGKLRFLCVFANQALLGTGRRTDTSIEVQYECVQSDRQLMYIVIYSRNIQKILEFKQFKTGIFHKINVGRTALRSLK